MDQEVKPWSRLALIFPGQGSQHVGMGQRLAQVSKAARDIFRRADDVLGRNLSKLCWEGPEEELESTANQQPATFVTSLAWLEALRERWAELGKKLEPRLVAGHSMGEFTAAVAAGSLDFDQGIYLVNQRGILMEEAGHENPGGMASIIGLPEATIVACDGSSRCLNSMSKLNVPLIMPTPALTVHLKWSSSMTSTLWSPGAHCVTWFGSVRNV